MKNIIHENEYKDSILRELSDVEGHVYNFFYLKNMNDKENIGSLMEKLMNIDEKMKCFSGFSPCEKSYIDSHINKYELWISKYI